MKNQRMQRRPRATSSSSSPSSSSRPRSYTPSSNNPHGSGGFTRSNGPKKFSSRRFGGGIGSPTRSRSGARSSAKKEVGFDVERFIAEVNSAPKNRQEQKAIPIVIKHKFADFDLPKTLVSSLEKNGFEHPTKIQDEVIPEILNRHDIVGIANTGTGKTLAFVLPLAARVLNEDKKLRVLIMCPTRELAQQVEAEVAKITQASPLHSVVCVGGMPIGQQIRALKQNPEFVIGTPGRLKDLLDRGVLQLSKFSVAVLDEADQMLDMGFINDMRYILEHLPHDRQTLLFSATMSDEIKGLVSDFTTKAKTISVKTQETALSIEQSVRRIANSESKFDVLVDILKHTDTGKTLVFGRTKRGVDRLARDLADAGINADSIHGDKDQRRRTKVLTRFRSHSIKVLVATDVAARGLDVDDISHVINYDVPQTRDDYVHRIGRTGRAGKDGSAITLI